ncbi:HNH endonuclease [Saccharomonospora cyanea]|uniref:HNH endonuclease n=1 Tax=Saccharomonospora cyanea TaxID=40989 RepID=UPI0018DEEB17|nr:hypothetical protein [Saccharomonospora cyanea]
MTCYYCDRHVDGHHHQHDHFPIPKMAGGTAVVPACLECHDLKDRYTLARRWPVSGYFEALRGLMGEALISLEKQDSETAAFDWLASHPSLSDEAVLARWSDLPPLSRVLYGKLRRLHEEELFRQRKNGLEPSHTSALVAALRSTSADRIRHNAS